MTDTTDTTSPATGTSASATSPTAEPERALDELLDQEWNVAMVMTMVDGRHTSRPVTCVEVTPTRLSFLVSHQSPWVQDIATGRATVHITFSDTKHNTYVSLNGSAFVTADDAERERLWSPAAQVWFDGPQDVELAIVRFEVTDGEYWTGPDGSFRQAIALVRGILTGDESAMGEQGTITTDAAR